jgi:DNA repair protein RadC
MSEEKQHYHGHRARLRERFLKSVTQGNSESLPDYEVLEMILFSSYPRQDVKPLAKNLITKFGSLSKVFTASVEELSREGLSAGTISAIKIIYEASRRLLKNDVTKKTVLQSWKALLDYCKATMSHYKKEQFRILFLDKKFNLIADEIQQEGTVDHTPVYPREVVKRALDLSASSIILVHNHPSGDATPSKADVEVTKQINQALASVNIKLHDHLIIAADDHYSFASYGLI